MKPTRTMHYHRETLKTFAIWVFPKIGVSENGWFIVENAIKMDDLGALLFLEIPIHFYKV